MCNLKEKGWVLVKDTQPSVVLTPTVSALPYPEHLSAACRAYTLSRRLAVLHGYRLGVLHFPFGSAFHTVCLHLSASFLATNNRTLLHTMSIVQ